MNKKVGKAICNLAMNTAQKSVSSMCLIILHQPKVPAKLKEQKLKK